MNITRRNFVRLSGMGALSVVALGSVGKVFGQALSDDGLFRVPVDNADPLNYLQQAHFEALLGTTFNAGIEGERAVGFRLKSVNDLSRDLNAKQGFHGESFSLVFENISKQRQVPGIYVFDHQLLGRFTLLLSPVDKTQRTFEAVINRIGR